MQNLVWERYHAGAGFRAGVYRLRLASAFGSHVIYRLYKGKTAGPCLNEVDGKAYCERDAMLAAARR